jgi:hypothetical protein
MYWFLLNVLPWVCIAVNVAIMVWYCRLVVQQLRLNRILFDLCLSAYTLRFSPMARQLGSLIDRRPGAAHIWNTKP